MLIFDTSSRLFFILIPHCQIPVHTVYDQSAPDEHICDCMNICKCFLVHKNTEEQHDRRCEVLQEANKGQANFLNTQAEQKKWNYGYRPRPQHPYAVGIH